ncbi:MAG: lipid-A-disaccharide synthase [Hyphomicrobiaceae bacterium]
MLVAGEHSGDALGAKLMAAINRSVTGRVRYFGVGGEHMAAHGLTSIFPLEEVAVMGPLSILPRLPRLVRRVYRTVDAAVAAEPDVVVIIDSPEFTHPIAKRIRKRRPAIPIIDYVSPSVWAWRPGRAARMRAYVDHVMALLPFEPEAHRRLGGPPCTYIGHPLIERYGDMRAETGAALAARLGIAADEPVLVVLPGSRASEVSRLMRPFGDAIRRIQARGVHPQVIVPAVASVRPLLEAGITDWPVRPHMVSGEADKIAAFRLARAALAASGTVTLELALAGTPMVVAYKVDAVAARLRFLLKVHSVVLANLVLGENAFPEYLQEACTPDRLADALMPLLADTPERTRQLEALARIPQRMLLDGKSPSEAAAAVVLNRIGL